MRAVVPEVGVRAGAGRAEGFVEGATADLGVHPAATAAPPALPAGLTPRLAGRLGDHTGCLFAANSAGQGLGWHAAAAQRTARGSKADRAAPTAGCAGLLVDWVGDQAVRTQRLAMLIAGGRFSDCSAARAGLGARFGHAVAAQPLPIDAAVQRDHPVAARTGRACDRLGADLMELVDKPQHARRGSSRTVPSEQVRVVFEDPGQSPQLGRPGKQASSHRADRVRRQSRV